MTYTRQVSVKFTHRLVMLHTVLPMILVTFARYSGSTGDEPYRIRWKHWPGCAALSSWVRFCETDVSFGQFHKEAGYQLKLATPFAEACHQTVVTTMAPKHLLTLLHYFRHLYFVTTVAYWFWIFHSYLYHCNHQTVFVSWKTSELCSMWLCYRLKFYCSSPCWKTLYEITHTDLVSADTIEPGVL